MRVRARIAAIERRAGADPALLTSWVVLLRRFRDERVFTDDDGVALLQWTDEELGREAAACAARGVEAAYGGFMQMMRERAEDGATATTRTA